MLLRFCQQFCHFLIEDALLQYYQKSRRRVYTKKQLLILESALTSLGKSLAHVLTANAQWGKTVADEKQKL